MADAGRTQDQELTCRLCGDTFIFSAGEQELYRLRGIDGTPGRCSVCRRQPPTLPGLPRVVATSR